MGCEHTFVPRYDEIEAREAVAASSSYAEALRKLGLRPYGGNHRLFRRWVDEVWQIPTEHFEPGRAQRLGLKHRVTPLSEVLVEHSSYSRQRLKRRLFAEGLKEPRCELCGQGEIWRGLRMALIIDHVNGVPDDNRLENLRIACPNCAATFETHCGRKNRLEVKPRACSVCGQEFMPRTPRQSHCSRLCGTRHANRRRAPRPESRKVVRPAYEVLVRETQELGFSAVGRKYGVSDNAVRK
ncbi:MAG: hypothetical protein QOF83_312, partial [Solirubrobacteraceae bacterium]|nr:hypothetical protein [Solirubrobacteraceae bacterium]